jgi:hypothetical protein
VRFIHDTGDTIDNKFLVAILPVIEAEYIGHAGAAATFYTQSKHLCCIETFLCYQALDLGNGAGGKGYGGRSCCFHYANLRNIIFLAAFARTQRTPRETPIFVIIKAISMDLNMITLLIAVFGLLVSFYTFYLVNEMRKKKVKTDSDAYNSRPLQLQAYERLVMLAERIAIPSLVSRANQQNTGLSSRQMQMLLNESIKQEYEYNSSQQIYVSPVAWEAIKNLKDQNMLIINQVAASLPTEASGLDLNRRLLEFMMASKKGVLHEVVLEALNFEAKKMMK